MNDLIRSKPNVLINQINHVKKSKPCVRTTLGYHTSSFSSRVFILISSVVIERVKNPPCPFTGI